MSEETAKREWLTQAMLRLDDGLRQIERKYDNVCLLDEDPETFGAGHFVLYPLEGSNSRFAIEEQYAPGIDWSDPDRVATSWLWRAEHIARRPDGAHDWHLDDHGEAFPEDLPELLAQADRWARRTHNRATQAEAFRAPVRDSHAPAGGRGL